MCELSGARPAVANASPRAVGSHEVLSHRSVARLATASGAGGQTACGCASHPLTAGTDSRITPCCTLSVGCLLTLAIKHRELA